METFKLLASTSIEKVYFFNRNCQKKFTAWKPNRQKSLHLIPIILIFINTQVYPGQITVQFSPQGLFISLNVEFFQMYFLGK